MDKSRLKNKKTQVSAPGETGDAIPRESGGGRGAGNAGKHRQSRALPRWLLLHKEEQWVPRPHRTSLGICSVTPDFRAVLRGQGESNVSPKPLFSR